MGAAVVDEDITEVGLSDYPGKYVILFWYPKDFTYVCPSGATYCRALFVHSLKPSTLVLLPPWAFGEFLLS